MTESPQIVTAIPTQPITCSLRVPVRFCCYRQHHLASVYQAHNT